MTTEAAEIRVSNISKTYKSARGSIVSVLEDISFDIESGEILCLLGPTGCGKTTLIKMIAELESPTTGTILFARSNALRPLIGYMAQNDSLLPWRTVAANVRLGLDIKKIPRSEAEDRVDRELARVKLSGEKIRYPFELSGGMRRKTIIARTLVLRPQLLLLDEPLVHLDYLSRQEIATVIREYIYESKASAVLATHSIEEAAYLGTKILLLNGSPTRIVEAFKASNNIEGELQDSKVQTSETFRRIMISMKRHEEAKIV